MFEAYWKHTRIRKLIEVKISSRIKTSKKMDSKKAGIEKAKNFMRQYRDPESRELKKLSANQFMEVWSHYDQDGELSQAAAELCVIISCVSFVSLLSFEIFCHNTKFPYIPLASLSFVGFLDDNKKMWNVITSERERTWWYTSSPSIKLRTSYFIRARCLWSDRNFPATIDCV